MLDNQLRRDGCVPTQQPTRRRCHQRLTLVLRDRICVVQRLEQQGTGRILSHVVHEVVRRPVGGGPAATQLGSQRALPRYYCWLLVSHCCRCGCCYGPVMRRRQKQCQQHSHVVAHLAFAVETHAECTPWPWEALGNVGRRPRAIPRPPPASQRRIAGSQQQQLDLWWYGWYLAWRQQRTGAAAAALATSIVKSAVK